MIRKILVAVLIVSGCLHGQTSGSNITVARTIPFNSKILNEERPIDIYLPPRYHLTSERYPVVILLDGERHFLHTIGSAGFLAGVGRIPHMIVVGIPNTDRNRDFTPTVSPELPTSGGAEKFIAFLRNELLPNLDQNFRTVPFRILVGHSLCGMFTLYQLFKHGDLFQGYISISPYLSYNDDFLLKMTGRKNGIPYYPGNRFLYLATGKEPDAAELLAGLQAQLPAPDTDNLYWKIQHYPEEYHDSTPLRAIPDGFSFIFDDWPIPDSLYTGGLDSVIAHYERFSSRYGYVQPVPETQLNIMAYQKIADGPIAEALRMFRYNVDLYPDSPNVYDSLGEGLEAAGLLAEAAEQYRIAIEKGRRQSDGNLPFYEQHLKRVLEQMDQ